jgi:uncharacterized protein (TIGR00730 family)
LSVDGEKDGRTVAVYCASSDGVDARYVELAAAVGRGIAARGWSLVSGGGKRSMMGAVARAAREGGAYTVGVIPRSMVEREWADTDSDELVVTEGMRERKERMERRSDAFLALPGGLGTCEELVEVWTTAVLDLHAKPVVVLDPDGHWTGLLDWVGGLVGNGFASRDPMESITVATDVSAALDACVHRAPVVP